MILIPKTCQIYNFKSTKDPKILRAYKFKTDKSNHLLFIGKLMNFGRFDN